MKSKRTIPFMSEQVNHIQTATPSRTQELKKIRSTSWWDRFLDRTTSYETANKSHYGNRQLRLDEWVKSSRTINPKFCWSEERAKISSQLNSRLEADIFGRSVTRQQDNSILNIKTERSLFEDDFGNVKYRGIKVNGHKYNKPEAIFDNVINNSTDTDSKITGCARTHYQKSNKSAFKLHYTDDELDTTEKVWQRK